MRRIGRSSGQSFVASDLVSHKDAGNAYPVARTCRLIYAPRARAVASVEILKQDASSQRNLATAIR